MSADQGIIPIVSGPALMQFIKHTFSGSANSEAGRIRGEDTSNTYESVRLNPQAINTSDKNSSLRSPFTAPGGNANNPSDGFQKHEVDSRYRFQEEEERVSFGPAPPGILCCPQREKALILRPDSFRVGFLWAGI